VVTCNQLDRKKGSDRCLGPVEGRGVKRSKTQQENPKSRGLPASGQDYGRFGYSLARLSYFIN